MVSSRCSAPRAVNLFAAMNQKNVVDIDFLPDWMYHYPDFIHRQDLEINEREKLDQLSSVKSLVPAITSWKDSRKFAIRGDLKIAFKPVVVDSGIKKRTNPNQTSAEREIRVDYCDGMSFLERLCLARTPEEAKKRVVELSSQDKESVLICGLTASEEENPFFLEYIRRHESSKSFFGERAHWQANVWETEFHLGFHELRSTETDDQSPTTAEFVNKGSQNQPSVRHIHSRPVSRGHHEINPVALSFRFTGDLRDRFWTCYFFSSITDGFNGFVNERYRLSRTGDSLYAVKQGQWKVLELAYVEKSLGEMRRSIDKILAAFREDLDPTDASDSANESLVFISDSSSLYLDIEGRLRIVSQQLDTSLRTIEQWERREEARGLRSRWSHKDEERHGGMLRDLTIKYKFTVQQLRVQQGLLQEQSRIADQRHSNLVSYKQLQEARTSNQSAADVRLFTYVTIIFLPLSFSSSLFSMGDPPTGRTLYVMILTTAVALMATFLLLANLKLMNRHWSFWVNKMNAWTREKMKANNQSPKWKDISRQLEKAIQRRLSKLDPQQGLPAESNWWYVRFWLSYVIQKMGPVLEASGARDKLSISRPQQTLAALLLTVMYALIFIVYTVIMMTVDIIHLEWYMACQLGRKMLNPEPVDQPPKTYGPVDGENDVKVTTKTCGRTAGRSLIICVESSPRPIRDYIRKMESISTDVSDKRDCITGDTATLNGEATAS